MEIATRGIQGTGIDTWTRIRGHGRETRESECSWL